MVAADTTSKAREIRSGINVGRTDCFSPYLYRERNAIERMFGRIKDFRRIATRYHRLATNFLAAVCLVASVCYWL